MNAEKEPLVDGNGNGDSVSDSEDIFEDAVENLETDNSARFPLHKAAFTDDRFELIQMLRGGCDVDQKDVHGNTALHLAVMLGHQVCALLLAKYGSPVHARNKEGWCSLDEAISYGDRRTIVALLKKSKQQKKELAAETRAHLVKVLDTMPDFYMELKWDFKCWVPLVSRIMPSDVCKIYKRGSSIRVDMTPVNFCRMKLERSDISLVVNSLANNGEPGNSFVCLDNKTKVYQLIAKKSHHRELEHQANMMMSCDNIVDKLVTKHVTYTRSQSGWIIRGDKKKTVGEYHAEVYDVQGIKWQMLRRREHLSEKDLARNKGLISSVCRASTEGLNTMNDKSSTVRESLEPPPKPEVSWEQYINSEGGIPPRLGRPIKTKVTSKDFKATVAMSENFPLTVEMLLNVLEVATPIKYMQKLRDFVAMKLPPGFPVKIEMPLFPTITGKVTFQGFAFRDDLSEDLFRIPADYVKSEKDLQSIF